MLNQTRWKGQDGSAFLLSSYQKELLSIRQTFLKLAKMVRCRELDGKTVGSLYRLQEKLEPAVKPFGRVRIVFSPRMS